MMILIIMIIFLNLMMVMIMMMILMMMLATMMMIILIILMMMMSRFGIQGSGIKYEAHHYWANWSQPVTNWVCGYSPILNTVIYDCLPEVRITYSTISSTSRKLS